MVGLVFLNSLLLFSSSFFRFFVPSYLAAKRRAKNFRGSWRGLGRQLVFPADGSRSCGSWRLLLQQSEERAFYFPQQQPSC